MTVLTIEEKLQHFTTVTIESVQAKCDKSLEEYKAELDSQFERHKAEAVRLSVLQEKNLQDAIERKASKEYTMEHLQLRRKINRKQSKLREKLFREVEARLQEYRKQPQYMEYLAKQIDKALRFAKGEEIRIYIDNTDGYMKEELEKRCKTSILVADYSFKGGMRAELPMRNILIDNTFETKLEEEMEKFVIGRKES